MIDSVKDFRKNQEINQQQFHHYLKQLIFLSIKVIKAIHVDSPSRNSNWYLYNNLFVFIKSNEQLYINLSINFENTGRIDTRWSSVNTKSSPDLNKGTTFALLSSEGKIPFTKDKLLIWVSGIFIQSLMRFITFGLKSSQPAALSPVNSPTQRASKGENVSIWWRHHENCMGCTCMYRGKWFLAI